jgi:ADP-ribosylglycohydrolase
LIQVDLTFIAYERRFWYSGRPINMDPHMVETGTTQTPEAQSLSLHNHVLGCLLGGACGDALGAPVEFLRLKEILAKHGRAGITEFDEAYGLVGAITDDTQMTLFTVEGLIRSFIRQSLKGISHPPAMVHHAYLKWLATQDQSFESRSEQADLDGWLMADQRLWARRAPGNTCLSALRSNSILGQPAKNNSKGCGTVMRAAPFGFMAGMTGGVPYAFDLAVESAQTTHGHPSARFASGALAAIIAYVVQGSGVRDAVERTLPLLQAHEEANEVCEALEDALRLSAEPKWRDHLHTLGEGWVAEEALAIVGASHGPSAIPKEWAEQVELRDVIETLAQDFTVLLEGRADAEKLRDRYPGH